MSKRKHQIAAYFQQGQRLHAAGRLGEAARVYQEILGAAPAHTDSLHMMGVICLQAGQPEAALGWLDRALRTDPSQAMVHVNRANALLALGRPAEALEATRTALRYKRNSAEANQTMGHALCDLGRPEEAIAAYREALRLNPRLADIRGNLGIALADAYHLDEAVEELTRAATLAPADRTTLLNLASALKESGRLAEAERIYRQLIANDPNDAVAHNNLGILLLLAGRYAEAWPEWEWRFQAEPALSRPFAGPVWQGEPLNGRTLLVHYEQGLGDAIQFARFLPMLPCDGRIVLEMPPALIRLLAGMQGVDTIVPLGTTPEQDPGLRCPIMSLPLALKLNAVEDIPADIPYLQAEPEQVASWRNRLAALPGLKVGLCWAGNPDRLRMDQRRSLPLARLAGLADIDGVSLVSLQKGDARRQLSDSPLAARIADWTDELTDLADTAALIAALDLVIGVDTAVIHLAGALGRPTWLLNRADTCWRWLLGRDDSPWYPTLRQFRQDKAGRWDEPIDRLTAALQQRAREAGA